MAERLPKDCQENKDRQLLAKERRLSKSTRAYIRRLKESGKLKQALETRELAVEHRRSRATLAIEELNKTMAQIACENDPVKEAAGQIKIVWLLNCVGLIESTDERNQEILEILDKQPSEFQPAIEALMPSIRDEMKGFLPLPLAG